MEKKTKIIIGLLILLILVASIPLLMMGGVVMWQLGVFSPSSTPPGCAGFSQVIPLDTKLGTGTDTLTLVLTNDAATDLTLDTVTATIGSETPAAIAPAADMGPGSAVTVNVVGFTSPQRGESYLAAITISYMNKQTGIQHSSTGECWGTAD